MKDVIISKEYLEKIRKFAAIRPDETFEYVPVAFREFDETMRPVFTLRAISGEKVLRYGDEMQGEIQYTTGGTVIKTHRGRFCVMVVQSGLIEWKNYYDVNGRHIEFSNDNFSCLSSKLIEELSNAILSKSSLTEEEILGLK